jgi:hypothetical protein
VKLGSGLGFLDLEGKLVHWKGERLGTDPRSDFIPWLSTFEEKRMNRADVNCEVDCVNGCVLGDDCPKKEYRQQASEFINNTSLDEMLAIADEAVRKKILAKASEPTQWVLPEDL